MSEFIDNPFSDIWDTFDIEDFKRVLCRKIDSMYIAKDMLEIADLLSDIDEMIMGYTLALRLKDIKAIEVIKMTDIPKKVMEELGIEDEDIIDGYIPRDMIPEDLFKLIEAEKTTKKNKWLKE